MLLLYFGKEIYICRCFCAVMQVPYRNPFKKGGFYSLIQQKDNMNIFIRTNFYLLQNPYTQVLPELLCVIT